MVVWRVVSISHPTFNPSSYFTALSPTPPLTNTAPPRGPTCWHRRAVASAISDSSSGTTSTLTRSTPRLQGRWGGGRGRLGGRGCSGGCGGALPAQTTPTQPTHAASRRASGCLCPQRTLQGSQSPQLEPPRAGQARRACRRPPRTPARAWRARRRGACPGSAGVWSPPLPGETPGRAALGWRRGREQRVAWRDPGRAHTRLRTALAPPSGTAGAARARLLARRVPLQASRCGPSSRIRRGWRGPARAHPPADMRPRSRSCGAGRRRPRARSKAFRHLPSLACGGNVCCRAPWAPCRVSCQVTPQRGMAGERGPAPSRPVPVRPTPPPTPPTVPPTRPGRPPRPPSCASSPPHC